MKRIALALFALPLCVLLFQLWYEPGSGQAGTPVTDRPAQLVRGEYLARAGNCMGCHTMPGVAIDTPFGRIHTPNITPDRETGIGAWSADDFWRALHNGKSRDGRFLYPAFPYPSYTKVSRADADALYAYIMSRPAVSNRNREHELGFPYNQPLLLAFWRALYFRPGEFQAEAGKDAQWNRGAYLVQGLGHCAACHTGRDALGGSLARNDLAGAMLPSLGWYAGSLALHDWEAAQIASLLKTGVSARGAVSGPMADIVSDSLQHLSDADTMAMARYLKGLPHSAPPAYKGVAYAPPDPRRIIAAGAKIYEKQCAACHMPTGEGQGTAYPPLAGNRSLAAAPVNTIRIVLNGGYPPSTGGNPRPYGMPPFGHALSDEEVAAVVSYIGSSWGNAGALVSPVAVARLRGVPGD